MDREKRIDELLATLPWTLGESEKVEVRRIIITLLEENDAEWETAMDARIDEIEKDRGHE
jgi:hypothetical protein